MEQLIQNHFDLDFSLLQANRRKKQAQAILRQAKYDLREAKITQVEYSGSFRAFRDKLTGKKEASETALRHAVQKAESDLAAAQQNLDAAEGESRNLEEALSRLPTWDSLKNAENEALWYRLDARYCTEWLIPHLEVTHELLLARRNQFNGSNAGQIKSLSELSDIYSAPEAAAESCVPYIHRLRAALSFQGTDFPDLAFFNEPTVFLSSATKFTQMDRINTAIVHTEKLQRLLVNLQTLQEA